MRLNKQNYGPIYELTIENEQATDLLLWMSFKKLPGAAPPEAFRCPGGEISTVTREKLGPKTARYLTGKFESAEGGEVRITVRRVMKWWGKRRSGISAAPEGLPFGSLNG